MSIQEIVEAMDFQTDTSSVYLDPETGQLYPLPREILEAAASGESRDGLQEWQQAEFDAALFVGGMRLQIADGS